MQSGSFVILIRLPDFFVQTMIFITGNISNDTNVTLRNKIISENQLKAKP